MPVFKTRPAGLKIIIVGAGKVGTTLVEQLSREGHDITIVDKDAAKINDITSTYDVMGCVGNGASYMTQVEAGVKDANLIIAVTESDELNLLCCTIAKQFSDCSAISRLRNPDYSRESKYLRDKLGLSMIINPDLEAAKVMARVLYLPMAQEIRSFAHGQAEIVKIKIPEGNILDKMTIADLGAKITNNILICGVERDGNVEIPKGSYELAAGDVISVVATRKEHINFLKSIGFATNQVKNVMIVGGGRSAYYLSNILLKTGVGVKIIEQDLNRCESLNELLPKAVIINGDGTNTELLLDEGIENADAFIPLTGIDEQNSMLALYAKKVSSAKLITKINRTGFIDIINSLDLGSVFYPMYITSDMILAYVRARTAAPGSNIETVYHLFDSRAESITFKVTDDSKVTGKPLKDLRLKNNTLISFISHEGEGIIPTGSDMISKGDTVMVVTSHSGFDDIGDILE
ncbi:MAG: Trk system potassium transporter TrkA [Clostridiales bacterium]|nr:Trk system potassium transporter TrkA [Clostridiales bacterium]